MRSNSSGISCSHQAPADFVQVPGQGQQALGNIHQQLLGRQKLLNSIIAQAQRAHMCQRLQNVGLHAIMVLTERRL